MRTAVRELREGDMVETRSLLAVTVEMMGPHVRYEEEALYPRLVPVLGSEHIDRLRTGHAHLVGNAHALAELATHRVLTDVERATAVELVREILSHVTACDGLSLVVETLSEWDARPVLAARDVAYEQRLDLFGQPVRRPGRVTRSRRRRRSAAPCRAGRAW